MKLNDAIATVKQFNKCKFDNDWLITLISDLDERIYREVLSHYHPIFKPPFVRYDSPDSDSDRELLVKGTYAKVYQHYCDSEIYRVNGEADKSNSSAILFNNAYKEFCDHYNRTHKHIRQPVIYY